MEMMGNRERGTGNRFLARIASERGSVGVVMALVIFVVMGMVTMTWNTAQLSKAKMRLQNAADSAALAHAVWQARGMNAVQNINDEMYEALSLAVKLRNIAKVVEPIALVFDAASNAPFVGIIFKGLAIAMHTIGVLAGGTGGWLAARICKYFLKYIEMFYVYGSSILGVVNAQKLASQNEADPLAACSPLSPVTDPDGWHLGIYTLGISWPVKDTFLLPLAESGKDEVKKAPWKGDKIDVFETSISPWKQIYKFTGAGDAWEIKPYVSKRGNKEGLEISDGKVKDDSVLPGPTFWIAFKLGQNIETLPLDGFFNPDDKERWTHKLPMFAIAAGQCITGDVVPHSKKSEEDKTNQRPAGFGAGATAKLVPVSQVFYKMAKGAGYVVDAIVYH